MKSALTKSQNPGMIMVITYATMFVVNSLIILLAHSLFPESVVLGTLYISETWAVVLSMGVLSLITTFAMPFIRQWEIQQGEMLSKTQWLVAYFAINFAGIWVVARFAEVLGLGLASWMTVGALALVLGLSQGAAMMRVEKWRQNKETSTE